MVTPVTLPGCSGSHGLTSKSNVSMIFRTGSYQCPPEEVVVRRVVVQIDILLLAIVQLQRERERC